MPKNSAKARFDNIAREGAAVTIEDVNYDECVRMAAREALETPKGIVIQDTAWEGYEEVPAWIMQGYGTMALEADEQLKEAGAGRPTHILVQAGVGSLAGAVQGYFSSLYPDDCPATAILEAEAAACLYKSACADDGDPRHVTGDLDTIMLAWPAASLTYWHGISLKTMPPSSSPVRTAWLNQVCACWARRSKVTPRSYQEKAGPSAWASSRRS